MAKICVEGKFTYIEMISDNIALFLILIIGIEKIICLWWVI